MNEWNKHTRDNRYDYEVMTRKQYKITRCKDFQSSQHDVQCNVTNVNNNSPQFIVGSAKKCSGNCTSYFVLEKRRAISPSPTEIVYWSRVTLCNLYYFIPRFSGVGIFFLPLSVVPEYASEELVENSSTESVEN